MRTTVLLLALSGCVFVIHKDDDDDKVHDTDDVVDTDDTDDTDAVDTDEGRPDHIPCEEVATPVALDEVTALGFSAADVLAAVVGEASATATFTEEHRDTTVTITTSAADGAVFVLHERTPAPDDTDDTDPQSDGPPQGAPDEGACPDWLEVPIDVRLATADGAFDEARTGTILTSELATLSAGGDLAWDALTGTWDVTTVTDPADWDTVSMSWSNQWEAGGTIRGQIDLSASRDDGGGVGSGLVGPVLRWPADVVP